MVGLEERGGGLETVLLGNIAGAGCIRGEVLCPGLVKPDSGLRRRPGDFPDLNGGYCGRVVEAEALESLFAFSDEESLALPGRLELIAGFRLVQGRPTRWRRRQGPGRAVTD